MRILNPRIPKEKKAEIISAYLTGDNSYEELSDYYKVEASTIRTWVSRYRKRENVVSLQAESKPVEDMARKKKEAEKSPEVALLEARIRELELQNLALNTLIDVAERNGIEIRKKSGAKQ
jgi:transposase-like protein